MFASPVIFLRCITANLSSCLSLLLPWLVHAVFACCCKYFSTFGNVNILHSPLYFHRLYVYVLFLTATQIQCRCCFHTSYAYATPELFALSRTCAFSPVDSLVIHVLTIVPCSSTTNVVYNVVHSFMLVWWTSL